MAHRDSTDSHTKHNFALKIRSDPIRYTLLYCPYKTLLDTQDPRGSLNKVQVDICSLFEVRVRGES